MGEFFTLFAPTTLAVIHELRTDFALFSFFRYFSNHCYFLSSRFIQPIYLRGVTGLPKKFLRLCDEFLVAGLNLAAKKTEYVKL